MRRIASLVPFWMVLLVAPLGCGNLCDDYCDCEGCSDHQYDECVDDLDDAERDAEDEGCGAEFDDYYGCLESNSECHGDDFETDRNDCDREKDDLKDCLH